MNYSLVNFIDIFYRVQAKFLDYEYRIFKTKKIKWNRDNKIIFLHILISEIINLYGITFDKGFKTNNVLLFNEDFEYIDLEIWQHLEEKERKGLIKLVKKVINNFESYLPFVIIDTKQYNSKDFQILVDAKIKNNMYKEFSFNKLKGYLKKEKLDNLLNKINNYTEVLTK